MNTPHDDPRAPSPDPQQILLDAARCHQSGDIGRAEAAYQQILAIDPNQPDALHLLGLIRSQRGEQAEAAAMIRQAITHRPDSADYHNSLGAALAAQGLADDAVAAYRKALRLRPEYVEAHFNLATLLHQQGDAIAAAGHYRSVLDARPDDLQARNNLGCAMLDQQRPGDARAHFEAALAADPTHALARQNLERALAAEQGVAPHGAPVVISAPTERNGVTLLQRLLNSTRQIIVYGEDATLFKDLPDMVRIRRHIQSTAGETAATVVRHFRESSTEFWSSNLWPDTGLYLEAMTACFERILQTYAQSARLHGFARWGVKHPLTRHRELHNLLATLPQARVLFIYRNPFDVVRSAKARQFVTHIQQLAQLAQRWNDNLLAVLDAPPPQALIVPYEALCAHPDEWLPQIEAFVGVRGIDPATLERRINTFRGDPANGHSPTEYIAPAALTAEETTVVAEATVVARERVGYDSDACAVAPCGVSAG